jgi:hypothetical protein
MILQQWLISGSEILPFSLIKQLSTADPQTKMKMVNA